MRKLPIFQVNMESLKSNLLDSCRELRRKQKQKNSREYGRYIYISKIVKILTCWILVEKYSDLLDSCRKPIF